jgi:hypothetical protein
VTRTIKNYQPSSEQERLHYQATRNEERLHEQNYRRRCYNEQHPECKLPMLSLMMFLMQRHGFTQQLKRWQNTRLKTANPPQTNSNVVYLNTGATA